SEEAEKKKRKEEEQKRKEVEEEQKKKREEEEEEKRKEAEEAEKKKREKEEQKRKEAEKKRKEEEEEKRKEEDEQERKTEEEETSYFPIIIVQTSFSWDEKKATTRDICKDYQYYKAPKVNVCTSEPIFVGSQVSTDTLPTSKKEGRRDYVAREVLGVDEKSWLERFLNECIITQYVLQYMYFLFTVWSFSVTRKNGFRDLNRDRYF
ncbi:hypothetical protein Taro_051911, partial [Colocasia esculenta]|nr:hypothetical protein [Colocasia esculenta]